SGFSRTTTDPSTTNFGQTWLSGIPAAGVSPLTDPLPVRSDGTRFDPQFGSALGLMAKTGTAWTFLDPNFNRARVQRSHVDLQRQFGANMMVSVAYSGEYTTDLRITRRLAVLPQQYWATGTTGNNTVASNLNSNVTNPFYIGNFASLQTSDPLTYQALASRTLNETGPYGENKAHSLELIFQRRFAQGLTIHGNFTALHERDRDFYNQFDA